MNCKCGGVTTDAKTVCKGNELYFQRCDCGRQVHYQFYVGGEIVSRGEDAKIAFQKATGVYHEIRR